MRKFGLISNSILLLLFVVGMPLVGVSQTWTAKSNVAVSGNSNGFYEYLPAGYFDPANANKKYPVILFIHGIGETGNGSWDLQKVLWTGLPSYINQGKFPSSFNVNGTQYSFIVICPQFMNWPGVGDVNAYYDYIFKTYRADVSRVYITGLSMGGGVTWDYVSSSSAAASKIAAVVPICGASGSNSDKCRIMADAKLPVWATHNADDPTINVGATIGFVDGINAFNPSPAAQKTIWPSGGHDAWTRTYDPATKLDGVRNCYEWMLQYSRYGAAPPPPPPTSTTIVSWIDVKSDVTCFGAANGSATVSFNGGSSPFTYSWNTNPVQFSKTASNLGPGTYTVTIKDANNATSTASVVIKEPAKLQLTVNAGTISTSGGTTSVTLSATGGTPPYTFSGPTNNVAAGTYTYSVTDAKGCTDTRQITISGPTSTSSPIVAWIDVKTDVSCYGGANGSATVSFNGGVAPFTYSWNTSPVQTSKTVTNLPAGTYTVNMKDANNATATASVTINQPTKLELNVSTGTISTSGGTTSVSMSATGGTPPYTYTGQTSKVTAGTYTYTVTDAKGCVASKTITITQTGGTTSGPSIIAWIDVKTDVSCFGSSNGNATVSFNGGVAPFTYSWTTNPVQSTKTASNLGPGTYSVTITDANNVTATATTTINEPPKLNLNVNAGTISVTGGTTNVDLSATGGIPGYTFTGPANPVKAGTYTFSVKDAAGCTDTKSVTITEPAPAPIVVTADNVTNVACNGGADGSATVSVTGGVAPYKYSWNTNPVQTDATATGLMAGTYEVSVTDALNVTTKKSVTITEPAKLVLNVTPGTITTYGGTTSVSLSASGGVEPYSYTGATSDVKAGTYNYEVKDARGCVDVRSVTIADATPAEMVASVNSTNVTCHGGNDGAATVSATGGVAPYKYSWNTNPVQTAATATGLKAGTYEVAITDALNTTTKISVNISEPAKLSLSAVAGTITSYGGTTDVTLTATGGSVPYEFFGVTKGLKAGTYSFEVKDAVGCKDTKAVTITEPSPEQLQASITDKRNVTCNGSANGSATASVTGGVAPYKYSWNTVPTQTGATATGLKNGNYTVTVTDALNAVTTATVTISEPQALSITASTGGITINGGTADVALNATGGTAPYTYSGQTNGLAAGTYSYTVTDAAGCTATTSVVVGQPDKLSLSAVAGTIKCNGGTTDVTLTATGGRPPYTYVGNTKELKAGVYQFSVTDAAGAKVNATVQIKEPATLELVVNPGVIKRVGGTTFVDINARGGTQPYTFTGQVSNLTAGTYNYVVSDANACTAAASVEIKEPKVNLAAFDVGTVDTTVRINWKTSYEYAIDHFTVERSTDGSRFDAIGAVNSRWTPAALLDYIMNDVRPSPSKNTYRIAAVTLYGEKLILQEKSLVFNEQSKIIVKNLAERLELSISSNLEESINFTLLDMNGRAIKSIQARKDVYTLRQTIDMQGLPRGTYVLRILSPTIKSSRQVIRL